LQASLRRFFQPSHPEAQKPVRFLPGKQGGRPLSREMKQIIAQVAEKQALEQKALDEALIARESEVQSKKRYYGGRPKGRSSGRSDLPVAVRAALVQEMELAVAGDRFSDETEFFSYFAKKFALPKKRVKTLWLQRSLVKKTSQKNKLSRKPHRYTGAKGTKRSHLKRAYRGFRLPGAGRKHSFPDLVDKAREWFNEMRSYGNQVLRVDLYNYYIHLMEMDKIRVQADLSDPKLLQPKRTPLQVRLSELDKQLASQKKSDKAKESLKGRLEKWCSARNLRPHLVTKLTPLQEQSRCHLTWQSFDRALWLAACSDEETLGKHVSKPKQFLEHRASLAILFADQIPLWIKAGAERSLFAEWERKPTSQAALRQDLAALHDKQLSGQADVDSGLVVQHPDSSGEPLADRFRLTYEARQVLLNYNSPGTPPTGLCYKGLIIISGPHARLSNISQDGKWLCDETFEWRGNLVSHKKGTSVGRLMEPWRALRAQKPHLFEHVSVMMQPSSNADSIILSWVAQELSEAFPALLVQRDCLGASFTESVPGAHFLGNTIQTLVAPKMTASLQLTDTDFSRRFKSLCRTSMAERRSLGQKALTESGKSSVWAASVEDICETIVSAQKACAEDASDWVLSGLRRNGMLAYRPLDGKLQPAELSTPSFKDLPQGSARLRSEWLEPRFGWVQDGIPSEPDWSLIPGTAAAQELLDWDVAHGDKNSEEDYFCDMDSLPPTLRWNCFESGVLKLPPALLQKAWKREASLAVEEKARILAKKAERQLVSQAKRSVSEKFKEAMRLKLKDISRQQALALHVPEAGKAKAKAKPASGKAGSLTKALKKGLKKSSLKTAAALLAGSQKKVQELISAPEPPKTLQGPLFGKQVRIVAELSPSHLVGQEGKVSSHLSQKLTLPSFGLACATLNLSEKDVMPLSESWTKSLEWQPLRLSRLFKKEVLLNCGLWCEDDSFVPEPVEVTLAKKPKMLLDQQMNAAWALVRHHFEQKGESLSDVFFVDAFLSSFLLQHEKKEYLIAHLQTQWQEHNLLFIPIYTRKPDHWTLLVLQKGSEGEPPKALLADSLKKDKAPTACANELKGLLADVDKSPLTDYPTVTQTSDDCGFFCLAVMVEYLSLRRGEGPKQRGSQHSLVADLKTKLSTFTSQLKAEVKKLSDEKEEYLMDQAVQLKKASDKAKLLAKKAEAEKGELSALQKAALKVLKEGAPPDVSDLGKEALVDIERIKTLGDPGVCSRCHWQSGCASCDVFKCTRFHVRELCRTLGKKPPAWAL
ncbi:unnamed protein product, partial [Symbiodinium sp. CCMP2592]